MAQDFVSVVFDRKKNAEKRGFGKIEFQIRLTRTCRKYIIYDECTPLEWEKLKRNSIIEKKRLYYEKIVSMMDATDEPMTIENLNVYLGIENKKPSVPKSNGNFLDFMRDEIIKEKSKESTKRQKLVTLDALSRWGGIKTFIDLTPNKLKEFDSWLREDGTRSDVAVFNYHKRMKMYVRTAYEKGIIEKNPYEFVHFKRGKCKERKPLSESELLALRNLKDLPQKEERVRDLFIFAAYTEKSGDLYYIDGTRLKTGSNFFTPILAPAMEVLKKYDYVLPKISNQKANDYLHLLEARAEINKNLTFHVARHSFATLSLSHDVPIEKVARMLGHQDIKTTQIYAKILKSTIERHADNLSKAIL